MKETEKLIFEGKFYRLEVNQRSGHRLSIKGQNEILWESKSFLMLLPEIEPSVVINFSGAKVVYETNNMACWRLSCTIGGKITGRLENDLYLFPDRIICQANYYLEQDHGLFSWIILPKGSKLNADKIFVYRGQHNEIGTGQEFSPQQVALFTSTKSCNWIYSPLSPRIFLKKQDKIIGLGGTRVANDYGIELNTDFSKIKFFRFNYGGEENPFPGKNQQTIFSPRLQITFGRYNSWHEANAAFTSAMEKDGLISPKSYRPEEKIWFRPWYCTWGDQMLLAQASLQQDVSQQNLYQAIKRVLSQEWILKTARLIRNERLNIGTIIIDDGWQDYRGDWNLDTSRFPDMKKMVNILHDLDFQVVLWWAPFILEQNSLNWKKGNLISGTDPYGQKVMDYSLPETQRWLEEKLRLWFGSGTSGWNIDGLKLDFFVEKVTPPNQKGLVSWRGEENCYYQLIKKIYEVASNYHSCPGIIAAPHCPSLMPYIFSVFLEERFDTNFDILVEKKEMVKSWLPGLVFSCHFPYDPSSIPEYLELCKKLRAIPQIGVLYGKTSDYLTIQSNKTAGRIQRKNISLKELERLLRKF
jgi:hypothetical protein